MGGLLGGEVGACMDGWLAGRSELGVLVWALMSVGVGYLIIVGIVYAQQCYSSSNGATASTTRRVVSEQARVSL